MQLPGGEESKGQDLRDGPGSLYSPPQSGPLLTSAVMVAAGLRELPGPGVSGHTCLRDSGLEGEPTGSVAWPRSSAGDKGDAVSWTHEQDLLSTHSEAPILPRTYHLHTRCS